MTIQPVLPPLLLIAIAAVIVAARVAVVLRLTGSARTPIALWRWAGMTLAALLLTAAAARPVLEPQEQNDTRLVDSDTANVFLVVDRSPDMRVADYADGRSRFSGVRDDIAALIDRYPGARVAVITFASRALLDWPLSADTWSLRPMMTALEPYPAGREALTQANAGAAGNTLRYQLFQAMQTYPRAKNLVFYLGAGTPESDTPAREFDLPDAAVDGGGVLGYGTAAGGPIPGTDVTGAAIGTLALRAIAEQIGVPYLPRDGRQPLASALPPSVPDVTSEPGTAGQPGRRTELYWAPAVLAAGLVLVELYFRLRDFRRTRPSNAGVLG